MQIYYSQKTIAIALLVCIVNQNAATAADIDVYFITGQSNAANFAQRAGTGATNVGYNLNFARDRTVFSDPNYTDQSFSANSLDTSQAVTLLSQGLFQSNDQAIFGFARNGTSISNLETNNWYPGANPAAGQKNDSSLYGDFIDWADTRLQAITHAGDTPIVKGLFWFQGERDAVLGSTAVNAYEANFENLVYRFREDFGANLPIISTDIREGVSTNANLRDDVNLAVANVAADDSLLSVVSAADLSWVSANDVHLNTAGYVDLAGRWSNKALELQGLLSPPETILYYDSDSTDAGFGGLSLISSQTDSAFVTTADTSTSQGSNTFAMGPHASQTNTVTIGSATDRMFQFGGDSETLSGTLEDAALDDGEWIGASLTAEQDFSLDSFNFDLFINNANSSNWAARDAGLFLRVGESGTFTRFGETFDGTSTGNQGTITFEDSFAVAGGETLEWRLAFTDRTNTSASLTLTRATRIGSINITASAITPEFEADFDGDGDVDLADLNDPTLGWHARFGIDLDGNDFLAWQQQLGSGVASVTSDVAAVPEPSALLLLGAALIINLPKRGKLAH